MSPRLVVHAQGWWDDWSDVRLPKMRRPLWCAEVDPRSFHVCTRRPGHSGRHAAVVAHDSRLVAVWADA